MSNMLPCHVARNCTCNKPWLLEGGAGGGNGGGEGGGEGMLGVWAPAFSVSATNVIIQHESTLSGGIILLRI